jgi:hypothetical protein
MFNQNSNDLVKQASQESQHAQNSYQTKTQLINKLDGKLINNNDNSINSNIITSSSDTSPIDSVSTQFSNILKNITNYVRTTIIEGLDGSDTSSASIPLSAAAAAASSVPASVPTPTKAPANPASASASAPALAPASGLLSKEEIDKIVSQNNEYMQQEQDNNRHINNVMGIINADDKQTRNNWVQVKDKDGISKYGYITKENIFQVWYVPGDPKNNPVNWFTNEPIKQNNGVLGCPRFPAAIKTIEINTAWENIKPYEGVYSTYDSKTPVFMLTETGVRDINRSYKKTGNFSCGNEMKNVAVGERPSADFDFEPNNNNPYKQGCFVLKQSKTLKDIENIGFKIQGDLGKTSISKCKRRAEDLGRTFFFMADSQPSLQSSSQSSSKPSRETITLSDNTQNMQQYRGKTGPIYKITITGNINNTVWGTNIYTDDSFIPKAAVNAGVVRNGEQKTVHIEMLPGQSSYQGSNNNSASTNGYGAWGGSYKFVEPPQSEPNEIQQTNANASNNLQDCYVYSRDGIPSLETLVSKDEKNTRCYSGEAEAQEDGFMKAYNKSILPRLYGTSQANTTKTPAKCPPGYNSPTADINNNNYCYAGWSNECGEECHKSQCAASGGTWVPLDYRYNSYTCQMADTRVDKNVTQSIGLYSLKSTGPTGVDTYEPEKPGLVGKIAFINHNGERMEYPRDLLKKEYSEETTIEDVAFMEVGNYDTRAVNDTYGVNGAGDNGVDGISFEDCKKRCFESKESGGFVFTGSKTGGLGKCQLKHKDKMFPFGLRQADPAKTLVLKLPAIQNSVAEDCRLAGKRNSNTNKEDKTSKIQNYQSVDSLQYMYYVDGGSMTTNTKCDITKHITLSNTVKPVDGTELARSYKKQLELTTNTINSALSFGGGGGGGGGARAEGFMNIREGLFTENPAAVTEFTDSSYNRDISGVRTTIQRLGNASQQQETINAFKEESNIRLIAESYKFILWSILAILAVMAVIKLKEKFIEGGEEESITDAISSIGAGASSIDLSNEIKDKTQSVTDAINDGTSRLKDGANNAMNQIKTGADSIVEGAQNTAEGLKMGITNASGKISDAVSNASNNLLSGNTSSSSGSAPLVSQSSAPSSSSGSSMKMNGGRNWYRKK